MALPIAFSSASLNPEAMPEWTKDLRERKDITLGSIKILRPPFTHLQNTNTAVLQALSAANRYAVHYPLFTLPEPAAPFSTNKLADIEIWLRHHDGKWVELYQNYDDPSVKVRKALSSGPHAQLCIYLSIEAAWTTGPEPRDFDIESGKAERRILLSEIGADPIAIRDIVSDVAAEAFHKAYATCPYGAAFHQELAGHFKWPTQSQNEQ